jgi:hypothetical protein
MDSCILEMEVFIKVSLTLIKYTEKDFIPGINRKSTKVNGSIIKCVDLDCLNGQMAKNMRVISLIVNTTEKEP